MKAVFVSCNQSMFENILTIMDDMNLRGFTGWEELIGRGSNDGEPHLGSHAWPSMNSALIAVMKDDQATEFIKQIKKLDDENHTQGIKAFAWEVSDAF